MPDYTIVSAPPPVEAYCRLRSRTGLSPKTPEAARIALPNTWYGIHVVHECEIVGMGRIIGDGGCFFQVVDIVVMPEHQGKGLGKQIMGSLMEYFEMNAPESAFISLIADGKAKELYKHFGFEPTAPASIGMGRIKT